MVIPWPKYCFHWPAVKDCWKNSALPCSTLKAGPQLQKSTRRQKPPLCGKGFPFFGAAHRQVEEWYRQNYKELCQIHPCCVAAGGYFFCTALRCMKSFSSPPANTNLILTQASSLDKAKHIRKLFLASNENKASLRHAAETKINNIFHHWSASPNQQQKKLVNHSDSDRSCNTGARSSLSGCSELQLGQCLGSVIHCAAWWLWCWDRGLTRWIKSPLLLPHTYLCTARVRTTDERSCPSLEDTCMTYWGGQLVARPPLLPGRLLPSGAGGRGHSGDTPGRWLQRFVLMALGSRSPSRQTRTGSCCGAHLSCLANTRCEKQHPSLPTPDFPLSRERGFKTPGFTKKPQQNSLHIPQAASQQPCFLLSSDSWSHEW